MKNYNEFEEPVQPVSKGCVVCEAIPAFRLFPKSFRGCNCETISKEQLNNKKHEEI